jgi:bifunctional enzyme CysN/CysC
MSANIPAGPSTLSEKLSAEADKDLLRLVTCGSVDDGKSTLLGRLLFETGSLLSDQLATLERDSRRFGTAGDGLDFALLLDGLEAEREQKITIDVAYRFFSTARRRFIVGDAPGHEQYTRNMATAASTAELAIILVDATKGVLPQTRRHAYIVGLLGVRSVLVAINKMDLVNFDAAVFESVASDVQALADQVGLCDVSIIPISALCGDNLTKPSEAMVWYDGPPLLERLENCPAMPEAAHAFRMPVQFVSRPDPSFRGYAGMIEHGTIRPSDAVIVIPSGAAASIERIVTMDGDLEEAVAGQSVTLVLDTDTDVSRGDIIASAADVPEQADHFAAHVLWLHEDPLYPERLYTVKIGTREVTGQITEIKHRIDVNTLDKLAARDLAMNEIAYCNINFDRAIPFEPYRDSRALGSFILIDRMTNATVGCGMLDFALWRASTVPWQSLEVNKEARSARNGHKPAVLWLTGLSGAGKSTIANELEKRLHSRGCHTYLLDGDNLRHGLNRDLGFLPEDRVENMRRVGEVAKLFVDSGMIVLASLISPFRNERTMVRDMVAPGEFIEIFVDTPLEECERRDPKGLYQRARAGELRNFTGIDSPYEAPINPEIVLNTMGKTPETLADDVYTLLRERGFF